MTEVRIIDVSPRDGLQIDPRIASLEEKVELVRKLVVAGIHQVEVTSFVRPDKVPQMADAEELMKALAEERDLSAIVLIPNLKGFERVSPYKPYEVNWVSAATEGFNEKNIGTSIEINMQNFRELVKVAKVQSVQCCFSVAVSFGCPYEGDVDPQAVLDLVKLAKEAGADRISIADTIGIAVPSQVANLMPEVLKCAGDTPVALHLHDTHGLGLANAYAGYEAGVRIFETAVSGIGGCPFAPGAAGNLATEDLVYMFERMGIDTGVDFERVLEAANYAASLSTKEPLGRIRKVETTKK